MVKRNTTPCWYFNQPGGCTKSAEQCIFNHVIDNVRKPLHIQHPCTSYHILGVCENLGMCRGDHNYELTEKEWLHHYPTLTFPGIGYLTRPWVKN